MARVRRLCAAMLATTALSVAPSASATSLDPDGTDWEGLANLVTLARGETARDRVLTPHKLDFEELVPEDALLIIHPNTDLDAGEIESFISSGGRVAVLDDYGTGDELLGHFGIHRVPLPSNPARMLRGNPSLALAEIPGESRSLPDSFRDLREAGPVVTNHATGLGDTGLPPLLVVRGKSEPNVLLAVSGAFGRGRFLAIGDASVVMNTMLEYPGNHALAVSLVRYLSGEGTIPSGRGRLYVLANDAALTGEFGTPSAVPKRLRTAAVDTLDALKQGLAPKTTYFVAVGLGLGVILWASSRAGRTYKESLPRFVRPIPIATQGGFAGETAALLSESPQRALVELRHALEEEISIRLGLDRPTPDRELVARVRARGMLGESDAEDLDRILTKLRLEGTERRLPRWMRLKRLKRDEIARLIEGLQRLLAAMDGGRRDRLPPSP
jgi:hypothetical protein